MFDGEGVTTSSTLFVPLLLLVVAAPVVLVAAIPELGLNLLSATDTQSSIHHHYTAGLIPPLVVATVLGAARVDAVAPGLRVPLAMTLVVVDGRRQLRARCGAGVARAPGRADATRRTRRTSRRTTGSRTARCRLIPDGAVVSATNSLGSHLSGRRRFLSFPLHPRRAVGRRRRDAARLRGPLGSAGDRPRRSSRLRRNLILAARLLRRRRARLQADDEQQVEGEQHARQRRTTSHEIPSSWNRWL